MRLYNLNFCDRFGYPRQIRQHFVEILHQVCQHLGAANIQLVVLLGSTSRGELTYEVIDDERIDVLSDYELLIVTRWGVARERIAGLSQSFSQNKARWGITNPLFHIDFTHDSLIKFYARCFLVRTIASFELFRTGVVIYGDDSVWNKSLPCITTRNLNIGATNELIIVRLWRQLQMAGENGSSERVHQYSDRIAKYFTARNVLEVLTIFLPSQGVLLPGYGNRDVYFFEHYGRGGHPFPIAFHEFMRECLDAKLHLKFTRTFDDYYEQMLTGFLTLTNRLVEGRSYQPPTLSELPEVCSRLIASKNLIFRQPMLWHVRCVVRDYRTAQRLKLPHPMKWALWEKRPYMLALLFYVHSWVLSQLRCYSLPDSYLSEAQSLLAQIQLTTKSEVQGWHGVVSRLQTILALWRGFNFEFDESQ